ncbi:hypothetical protein [Falsiroseomonas bella]|uniref:hypothetical protein n=1 Tax=Falsiroseomonas bella TaxID=2184016 RepID=UPI0011B6489F|nr:hypothetical protein [Falsiroseomonas bella]
MSTSLTQIWFGVRAVDFTSGSSQLDTLDDSSDFATRDVLGGTYDYAGSEWQQLLAFVGTTEQQAALGVDLTDGVNAPTAGAVNTTGDLQVGEGVVAHNLADMGGGTRLTNTSAIDRSNDPVSISGHGKLNGARLTSDVSDNWVTFSNDIGFGFVNGSGWDLHGNATRLNDGDSITFDVADTTVLKFVSFTVKVLGSGATNVVLDSDSRTIADTNGALQGGFVQDASAGELDLGVLAHGTKVEIDYELGKILVNGSEVGDTGGFFVEFLANGGDKVTFGSVVGNATGWSVDDLVLTVGDDGPDIVPGAGVLSLDLFRATDGDPAPGGLLERHLYAYLDANENNAMDGAEPADAENLGRMREGYEAYDDPANDGDDNPVQGAPATTDWLDMYAFGWANAQVESGHQYGEHVVENWTAGGAGRFALGVNTARDSADVTAGGPNGSPADIETGTDTYSDGAPAAVDRGEVLGFVLKASAALSATITYGNAADFTPEDAVDIIVRLYQGSTLIEEIEHDITGGDGSFTVSDNFGGFFNRMEIQAAGGMDGIETVDAGASFALVDLDFRLAPDPV